MSGASRIIDTDKIDALRVAEINPHQAAIAPRSGAMTSTSLRQQTTSTTLGGGKRRVHQEGLKMLDNHYRVIEERTKLQSMENRIRRLEFEEQRARKMEQLANQRIDSQMQARSRHFEDMVLKKNYYINMQINENMQREKNLARRAHSRTTIQQRRLEAMSANRMAKEDTMHEIQDAKSHENLR